MYKMRNSKLINNVLMELLVFYKISNKFVMHLMLRVFFDLMHVKRQFNLLIETVVCNVISNILPDLGNGPETPDQILPHNQIVLIF